VVVDDVGRPIDEATARDGDVERRPEDEAVEAVQRRRSRSRHDSAVAAVEDEGHQLRQHRRLDEATADDVAAGTLQHAERYQPAEPSFGQPRSQRLARGDDAVLADGEVGEVLDLCVSRHGAPVSCRSFAWGAPVARTDPGVLSVAPGCRNAAGPLLCQRARPPASHTLTQTAWADSYAAARLCSSLSTASCRAAGMASPKRA
jgi:hypothetical protein